MKNLVNIILFVFTITISNFVIGQDSLKIMTYNIQGMKPGTMSMVRIGYIIEKIKDINPDIIGLQEINESIGGNGADNQCHKIANSLSEHFNVQYNCYQQFTHLSWDNQFREFIGIISKYPVIDSGFYQLATGVFPRKVVWNYIETPLGKINFLNTHLSYNSSSVRLQQAGQIIDYADEIISEYPASATFLTGDFNDSPDAASIQLLTNTESDTTFIDSYAITNPESHGYTVPSNAPNKRIDYVFMSNIGSLQADTSFVVPDSVILLNLYTSDHLAVVSVFTEGANSTGHELRTHPGFELFQNYPNPFDSYTSIGYVLHKPGYVKLSVFNQFGVEVAVLSDGFHQAGKYVAKFEASKLPGNIYYYSLKSDSFAQTKIMSVVR